MNNNTKYPGEIVGYIYRTTDYDAFKKLAGNRDVFDARKKKIKASIQDVGWVRNPVVVNEKMEIVDGQGRTEALEDLGMPIEYVVAEGATTKQCIALNLKQTNWRTIDFLKSKASLGDEQSQQILRHVYKFGTISVHGIIMLIANGSFSKTHITEKVLDGSLKIYDEFTCDELLQFVSDCLAEIGRGMGSTEKWCYALKTVFFSEEIDSAKFLKCLKNRSTSLKGATTYESALAQCETLYNYGTSDKIYFAPIAARIRKETKR